MPTLRSSSRHQLELIQRYARLLRQQTALHRGPRIGARERRLAREATTRRAALDGTRPPKPAG